MPVSGGGGGVEIVSLTPPQPPSYIKRGVQTGVTNDGPQQPNPRADRVGQGMGAGIGPGSGGELGNNSILTEIRKRIERAKEYPPLARRQGVEGVVGLSFQIGPEGRPYDVKILQSSSSELLNDAALATIQKGAPFPPYPDPLQVKIEFSLRD